MRSANEANPPGFHVTTGPSTVIVMTGDFDLAAARGLKHDVDAVIESARSDVVLDMAGVEFLDSSGVAMLLRIRAAVVRDGKGAVRVTAASTQVTKTFELCGLREAFGMDRLPTGER